ncbi:MAG: MFS transporter [Actinomycetota bacterium]
MKRIVAVMALCAVVSHTLGRSTYPILLPAIAAELLSSHQQSGLLTTVNFGGYLLGVLVMTAVSGRFEPARLLVGGLGLSTAGFVLLATAGGFGALAAGLLLTGLGSAGIWMTAPVIATGVVPAGRRGTVMGLLSSTMGLGLIAVSQGTNLVRSIGDDDRLWRPTWWAAVVYGGLLLAATGIGLRLPATARIAGGVSLGRLRTVPDWVPVTVAYWLFGFVVSSFTPFFGAALEEVGFTRTHVGNLYALFGLSAVVGAVSLGRVSDRIGRQPVLVGALLAMAVASLLVLTGSEPYAAMAAMSFGAASFTFPVLVAAYLSDHLQERAFANAFGALTLFYGSALILGPVVSGTIGDSALGFPVVFALVAAAAVTGAVVLLRVGRRTERPELVAP